MVPNCLVTLASVPWAVLPHDRHVRSLDLRCGSFDLNEQKAISHETHLPLSTTPESSILFLWTLLVSQNAFPSCVFVSAARFFSFGLLDSFCGTLGGS